MKIAFWTAVVAFAATAVSSQTQTPSSPQYPPMMGQQMLGGHGTGPEMMGHGMMTGSIMRHHQAMMYGVPETYRLAHNPLPISEATLRHGADVYAQSCAACHGVSGHGDGAAGQQLSPRPADLSWLAHSHMADDGYVYWTVAEGGQPVGSAMPAFKESLSQNDIWSVVTYVRNGLDLTSHR